MHTRIGYKLDSIRREISHSCRFWCYVARGSQFEDTARTLITTHQSFMTSNSWGLSASSFTKAGVSANVVLLFHHHRHSTSSLPLAILDVEDNFEEQAFALCNVNDDRAVSPVISARGRRQQLKLKAGWHRPVLRHEEMNGSLATLTMIRSDQPGRLRSGSTTLNDDVCSYAQGVILDIEEPLDHISVERDWNCNQGPSAPMSPGPAFRATSVYFAVSSQLCCSLASSFSSLLN